MNDSRENTKKIECSPDFEQAEKSRRGRKKMYINYTKIKRFASEINTKKVLRALRRERHTFPE